MRCHGLLLTGAISALTLLVAASAAEASGTDSFGFGGPAIAMGGAFTALATDYSATYYNPAGLAFADDLEITLGFSYAGHELDYKAEGLTGEVERDVERQEPLSAYTVGLAARLGDEDTLLGRVGLGLGALLPTRKVVGFVAETGPGVPSYYLYGRRRTKVGVMPAVAVRLLPFDGGDGPGLSIGGGVTILADLGGEVAFDFVGDTAARTDMELVWDIAPNFGVYFWPLDWLSLGVTYRGELSLKVDLDIIVDLDGDGISDLPLNFEAVTLFQPQQVQVGVAFDPLEDLTLAFDLTWYDWSAFKDPYATVKPIIGQYDPDASDVFVPRVGATWRVTRAVALHGGYFYEASPFPEQSGATNIIDPDKHVLSCGVGYTYWTERERFGRREGVVVAYDEPWAPFSIEGFFQLHVLEDLKVSKDDPTTSGGVGSSFEAGGFVWNAGIFVKVRL